MNRLEPADAARLVELAPVLRRCVGLDPSAVARLWLGPDTATVLVRLPFSVLVSRTVSVAGTAESRDLTVAADQTLAWLDGERAEPPDNRDADWRGGAPPRSGWRRLDTVPDEVIRGLVRSGALALKDAAAREGVPGAQPRAAVADALLDSVVLTVEAPDDDRAVDSDSAAAEHADPTIGSAPVTLRPLSALTRMGFLPRGGAAAIDVSGRWIRIAAGFGTVYSERPGFGLTLR